MNDEIIDELVHLACAERGRDELAALLLRIWRPGDRETARARIADLQKSCVRAANAARRQAPRKRANVPQLVEHLIASGEASGPTQAIALIAQRVSRSESWIRRAYYDNLNRNRDGGRP
jgi:hypothetical protein